MSALKEFLALAKANLKAGDNRKLLAILSSLYACPYAVVREGGTAEPGINVVVDLPEDGISSKHALLGINWKKKENRLYSWVQFKVHDPNSKVLSDIVDIAQIKPSKSWRQIPYESAAHTLSVIEAILEMLQILLSTGFEIRSDRTKTDCFRKSATGWFRKACKHIGDGPGEVTIIDNLIDFLSPENMAAIAYGISSGTIIDSKDGYRFTLAGLSDDKGPYSWFSKNGKGKDPRPNWEYFVHVAEYIRYKKIAETNDLVLTFEDGNMDMALYEGGKLSVCCEIKREVKQLDSLLKGILNFADGVDFSIPDRGNDSLRKAKYLVMFKPKFLALVAAGARRCYRVTHTGEQSFTLEETRFPYST